LTLSDEMPSVPRWAFQALPIGKAAFGIVDKRQMRKERPRRVNPVRLLSSRRERP
jgi:hypothetical protein